MMWHLRARHTILALIVTSLTAHTAMAQRAARSAVGLPQ